MVIQTEASQLTKTQLNDYMHADQPFIKQWAVLSQQVGILIQDPTQFMRVYQAVQAAGLLPVVLDSKWTPKQLHQILDHYEIRQVIADKHIEGVSTIRLEQLNEAAAENDISIKAPPEGLLHIGFTSGTTGLPKGYYRNKHSWDVSYDANNEILNERPTAIIAPGPLAHSLTLYAMMYAYHIEVPCLMQMEYHPVQLLHQLKNNPKAIVFLVPSVLEQLLHFDAEHLNQIQVTFLTSGAKLEPHTIARFKEKLPKSEVIEFFGTSEASFISYHHVTDYAPNNVGKLFKGVKVILTSEDGKVMDDVTTIGQLHVQSDMVFSGYVGQAAVTNQDIIATGDYARMTSDDDLILEGRVNNKCIVGGMNVYPEEVEQKIREVTSIEQVMVSSVPHYELGEVLIAYYVSEDDMNISQLKKTLRSYLERYKVPMCWIKVPKMLFTSSGKVARQAMKEQYGRNK